MMLETWIELKNPVYFGIVSLVLTFKNELTLIECPK